MVKTPSSSSTPPARDSDVKYKGVRKRKWGKFVSEIRLPNSRERIWLGSFDTPEKAARAFDAAQFCLRGSTANFNFPHQPPDIPGGSSLPRSQIQATAARYANEYQYQYQYQYQYPYQHTSPDNNSSTSSSYASSTESTVQTDQDDVQMDQSETWTSPLVLDDDFNFMNNILSSSNNTYGVVPDFGIYPGFDDYLMTNATTTDYGEEEICVGSYPSFLWNF